MLEQQLASMGLHPSHARPLPRQRGPLTPGPIPAAEQDPYQEISNQYTPDRQSIVYHGRTYHKKEGSLGQEIRSNDFSDRDTAARAVAHKIKHTDSAWTFQIIETDREKSNREHREDARIYEGRDDRIGPFGRGPRKDQSKR